jgi:branched-chain amino acid transport system substrate-binding protein
MLKKKAVYTVALALSLGLVGCSANGGGGGPQPTIGGKDNNSNQTAAPQDKGGANEPLRVGLALSFSGPNNVVDQPIINGILMAIQQINDSGGVGGHKIEYYKSDVGSSDSTTVSAVQQLVENNHVSVIFGPSASTMALAVAPYIEQKHIVQFGYGSFKDLTKSPWFFRTRVPDPLAAAAGAKYLVEEMHQSKIAISHDTDQYGEGADEIAQKTLKDLGTTAAADVAYNTADRDLTSQMLKMKQAGTTAVYDIGHPQSSAIIAQQNKKLATKFTIMGTQSWGLPATVKLAGDAANGIFFTTDLIPQTSKDPTIQKWVQDYTAAYHEAPSNFAAQGYDSMELLAQAVKNANGAVDGSSIQKGVLAIHDYKGIDNTYTFGQTGATYLPGDGGVNTTITKITDGNYELVKEIQR